MTTKTIAPNLNARFQALLEVASPAMLQASAAALLGIANTESYAATGEGVYLASLAHELRSRAYEKMTGVGV